jgi:hypothetical protein
MKFTLISWDMYEDQIVQEVEDWLVDKITDFYDVESIGDMSNEQLREVMSYAEDMYENSWLRERLIVMIRTEEEQRTWE